MPAVSFSQVRTYLSSPETARSHPEESSSWYTPEEDGMMRQALVNDMVRMRRKLREATRGNGGVTLTQADLEECVGLDAYLNPRLVNQARLRRRAHVAAILQEQTAQRAEGGHQNDGSASLSQVSSDSSSWARMRAYMVAQANLSISEGRSI